MPRKGLIPPGACLISGALFALCLPTPGLSFMGWIAPAGLFWFLPLARTPGQAARWGMLFGFAFCAVSLNWIYFTCRFAGVPVPVALLAIGSLAGMLSLNWALFGAGVKFSAGRYPAAAFPWIWAVLWTALESASAHWTPRVGVDLLAYTQWRCLPLTQIGALLGPHALGFLLMLWGAALAEWIRSRTPRGFAARNAAAALVLLAACGSYGAAILAGRGGAGASDKTATLEILQPNIDQYQKWDERFDEQIRERFDGLLGESRLRAPDLIIWPESSLPGWLDSAGMLEWISGWARQIGAPMIIGTISRSADASHNSAVLIGADGEVAGLYHKRRLVPFGEFVPLRGLFEPWIGILAQMGDFDRGPLRQELMPTAWGRAAATICYEAVFPHLARTDSVRGARVLVNLTNDGWYKETWGPFQHFYTNMFRAVENRAFVFRAANTGISGVIDPYGVVLAQTGLNTRQRLTLALPAADPFPRGSLFSRTGDVFGAAAMLGAVFLLAWPLRRRPGA